ncbi:protein-tyrosine phosphatase [Hathewaya proteolytica DSM 3090]|uniref:protein-tyrosine-phosphatase n=1 Tax=Hathewaya proteolytica DSM 3090 TaxID=1121331 RepID=A0A1M6Q2W6_9CLOT|nr:CpsB/CapC family capsule biosynthesis tyrosine phosphatase [Hathewaya proteolytica]SHK14575.1 protein-tyrosine phosphatase [Hathewaya proteolytica DSM 3090]
MIDFHSHIVYGVDDGADDENIAIEMIKIASCSGTKKIVATPHFKMGKFYVSRETINKKVKYLKDESKNRGINIEIYAGQEVYYSEDLLEYYRQGEIDTIENTRYMLIELPMGEFSTEDVINNIYELQIKGIVPILAHPERYKTFINSPTLINRFIEEGFLFQLNVGSAVGDFGGKVKKTAETFIKNGIYSVFGSDAHHVDYRNTDMTRGVEVIEKINPKYLPKLRRNGEKILRDELVGFSGNLIKKRNKFLSLLFP